MQSEITKKRLPYLLSAAFIIRKAAQTHQISFKEESRNVGHGEKFYTAGVIRVQVFWQSTGPITGIREPNPFEDFYGNKRGCFFYIFDIQQFFIYVFAFIKIYIFKIYI